jgi:hypothetical protein
MVPHLEGGHRGPPGRIVLDGEAEAKPLLEGPGAPGGGSRVRHGRGRAPTSLKSLEEGTRPSHKHPSSSVRGRSCTSQQ